MSISNRFSTRLINTHVDLANFSQFGIEQSDASTLTPAETAAQILAYTVMAGSVVMAGGTLCAGIWYGAAGSTASMPLPFPVAEWAALKSDNDFLPAATDWGVDVTGGTDALAPLGTSVVVTEYTNVAGPHGRGRHFLPFITSASLDANGFLDTGRRATVLSAYNDYILIGDVGQGSVSLDPVVENAAGTTAIPITSGIVQPVMSNLRSRRR